MFTFLKYQYVLGNVDKTRLQGFVPKWISADDYKQITGEDYKTDSNVSRSKRGG